MLVFLFGLIDLQSKQKSQNLFEPASKTGIESKAQLITANDEIEAASAAEKVLRIIKNLQPISMGV
jgi:hypothetical protein